MSENVEKIICTGENGRYGNDFASMMALMNQNSMWGNNPWSYIMMMYLMRTWGGGYGGDGYGYGGGHGHHCCHGLQDAEIMSRLNNIAATMADNHNTDLLQLAIRDNHAAMHELASTLNMDFGNMSQAIGCLKYDIAKLGGETGFGYERVINAITLGDSNIISQLKDCCCQNKQLVQQMGYEGQIRDMQNTNAIMRGQSEMTFALQHGHNVLQNAMAQGFESVNRGLTTGFAQVGFASEQQTCRIEKAIAEASQRQIDIMNQHWTSDLRDKLAQMSQDAQTANIVNQLRGTCQCGGCGC